MSHLWSGRFSVAPDAAVFEFGRSFPFDRRLFEDDVTGSLAWAEALQGAGAIDAQDARTLVEGLAGILESGHRDPAFVAGPDEDVHAFVERVLIERVGEAGKRLHTGRSRNEQVSLDLRLYLRRRIPALQAGVVALVRALAGQARRAGGAVMASYTHLRPAQPVLVAHYLLAHVEALRRDHAQLEAARDAADAMPLGSGAIAGTAYAVDVHALAGRLGFSRVVANSIDATSDRDFAAAFLFASALAMVHLSRLGEDLVLLTGEEFGVFELSDAVATGSSLMPQKKNPDPLELIRGKAGRAIGHLTGWLATMKGLPAGYNKDLQEDKEAVFDAEDTLGGSLAAAAAVVGGLSLNARRARERAFGLLLATDVADYLVARGLPFREAHHVVAGLVRTLAAEGRGFESLSMDEWRQASPLFGEDVREAVTPEAAVAARRTPQSTNPGAVARALDDVERWIGSRGN
ncbi:MAG: argininosuccinate lyase [Acidobacteria bacterium]|nr:MAG: argininosuccinate lyase [Acidobacteriota bacterium]